MASAGMSSRASHRAPGSQPAGQHRKDRGPPDLPSPRTQPRPRAAPAITAARGRADACLMSGFLHCLADPAPGDGLPGTP